MDDPHVTSPTPRVQPQTTARQQPLARASWLPWLLFLAALAALAWVAWKAYGPDRNVDPSGVSAVALQKQNRLQVLKASFSTVTVRQDCRFFCTIKSTQIAVIPAVVNYYVDLATVGRDRVTWSEENKNLTVQVPAVRVEQPNLLVDKARFFREGIWITNAAQEALVRKNVSAARAEAIKSATSAGYLDIARNAARDAIRQNLAIPLQVAGFGDVTVNVRFDGEPATR